MNLFELVRWMDEELRTAEVEDYAGAMNGLQVQNSGKLTKVACAVDASLPVVREAVARGADLLIVHHGIFWQGAQALRGAFFDKVKCALDGDLAIYSSHLPLDVHPVWGNNAALAREVGLDVKGGILPFKGMPVGLWGEMEVSREELLDRVSRATTDVRRRHVERLL